MRRPITTMELLKKNGLLISALGPELWRFKDSVLFGDGALISLRPLYIYIYICGGTNASLSTEEIRQSLYSKSVNSFNLSGGKKISLYSTA
jgi:hypothetical protein